MTESPCFVRCAMRKKQGIRAETPKKCLSIVRKNVFSLKKAYDTIEIAF